MICCTEKIKGLGNLKEIPLVLFYFLIYMFGKWKSYRNILGNNYKLNWTLKSFFLVYFTWSLTKFKKK